MSCEKRDLSAGKSGLREPKKLADSSVMNTLCVVPFFIIAVLYGVLLNIRGILAKHLWAEAVSFKGRVCFVTGSGRGLGRQICLELAKKGARVACADINEETNRETMKLLEEMGATARTYKLNVANRKDVLEVVGKVEGDLGPVYLVVNNAAIVPSPPEYTEDYIRATFNVNTLGPIWVTQAFLPGMEERNSGNVVNICSVAAYHPVPASDIYSATKAALRSYSHSVNMRLKEKGSAVKITVICPTLMKSRADYTETQLTSKNRSNSVITVADAVMRAVSYGFEDITVPRIAKDLIFFQWLPKKAANLFFNLTGINFAAPTIEGYEYQPTGQIVRECS